MTMDDGIGRLADTLRSGHFDMCDLEDAADAMQRLAQERDAWKRRAKAAERLKATSEWISVKDRLPLLGKCVLATDGAIVSPAYFNMDMKFVLTGTRTWKWFYGSEVTQWKPLPEAPGQDKEDSK